MSFLSEVRHLTAGSGKSCPVWPDARPDISSRWLFLPQTCGGSIQLSQQPSPNYLTWHLDSHSESALQLQVFDLVDGPVAPVVQIPVSELLFPGVPAAIHDGKLWLCLLTSSKSILFLQLPLSSSSSSSSSSNRAPTAALLSERPAAAGRAEHGHMFAPQQLSAIGTPTSMTITDGCLCIAGTTDTLFAVPLQSLKAGLLNDVLLVNISVGILKRWVGSLVTSTTTGAAAALPVTQAGGQQSLLLLHQDGALRGWALDKQQQLFSIDLHSAADKQLTATTAVLASSSSSHTGSSWVVWQLEPPEGAGSSVVGTLQLELPAEGTPFNRQRHVRSELQLQLPVSKARVQDARVYGSTLLLLLAIPGAPARVCCYSTKGGEMLGELTALHSKGPSTWGVQQDLWEELLQSFPEDASPANAVVGRLLAPGQLCLTSLAAALSFYGAAFTLQQLQAASVEELQRWLEAAAAAVSGRHPSYSTAACWQALFAKYCELWDQQHGLLCLLPPHHLWAGCYRAGGLVTLVRPVLPLEAWRPGSSIGSSRAAGRAGERLLVQQCLATVRELLGAPCMKLMTQLVSAGVDVNEVLPRFLDLLCNGPQLTPAAAGPLGGSSPSARARVQRLETWSAGGRERLLQLEQQLAGLPEPLSIIGDYVNEWHSNLAASLAAAAASQYLPRPAAPIDGSSSSGVPLALGLTLTSITRQLARAACQELQALLLLLGYLLQQGSVSGQQLLDNEVLEVQEGLMPRVLQQLKAAAMAMWLCKTPAQAPVAPAAAGGSQPQQGVGPLLDLQFPGTATKAGVNGSSKVAAAQQAERSSSTSSNKSGAVAQPMAVHFLQPFWTSHPAVVQQALGGELAAAALQLLQHLMAGAGPVSSWSEEPPTAADTAVRLAYVLFLSHEYAAVAALVKLAAGGQLHDPGLRCMLGLSMVAGRSVQQAGTDADLQVLAEAQGHLMAATEGLQQGALHEVLVKLLQLQGGSTFATAVQLLGPPAAWQQVLLSPDPLRSASYSLVFSEVVMKLFDRVGCYSGAMVFAEAALDLVPKVYLHSDPADYEGKAGELSSAVFLYACKLGRWDTAYTAVVSNPVDSRRLEDAKRLVEVLVEAGELQVLAQLSWEGSVARQAGPHPQQLETIPLRQVVVEVLERQALYSDLATAPGQYQLAADFLLTIGDLRGAAAAHLGLARRLRHKGTQGHTTLEHVQAAYDAAQLLLSSVPPHEAWLDKAGCVLLAEEPTPHQQQQEPVGLQLSQQQPFGLQLSQQQQYPGAQEENGEEEEEDGALKQLMGLTTLQLEQMANAQLVVLGSLAKEAARFTAAVAALQQVPDLRMLRRSPGDDYLLQLLLTAHNYEAALQLAFALWKGPQLEQRLEKVAVAMAQEAGRLQAGAASDLSANSSSSSTQRVAGTGASSCGSHLSSPAAACWLRLQQLLQWCDLHIGPSTAGSSGDLPVSQAGGRLRVAVVNALLMQQPALELPAWLTSCFGPRLGAGGMAGAPADPAALLRVYLNHGRLLDAAALVLDHLAGWQAVQPLTRTKSSASVWLPLHHIEQVLAGLQAVKQAWAAGAAGGSDRQQLQAAVDSVDEWVVRLQQGLDSHITCVAGDSSKLLRARGGD